MVAIGDEDEEISAPARLTLLVRAPFRLHQHIRRVGCDAEGCPLGIGARRSEHRRIECGAGILEPPRHRAANQPAQRLLIRRQKLGDPQNVWREKARTN